MTQVAIILLTFTPYHPGSFGLRFIYLIRILLYCVFVALKKLVGDPLGMGALLPASPHLPLSFWCSHLGDLPRGLCLPCGQLPVCPE